MRHLRQLFSCGKGSDASDAVNFNFQRREEDQNYGLASYTKMHCFWKLALPRAIFERSEHNGTCRKICTM